MRQPVSQFGTQVGRNYRKSLGMFVLWQTELEKQKNTIVIGAGFCVRSFKAAEPLHFGKLINERMCNIMPIYERNERRAEGKKRRRVICGSGASTGTGYDFARKDIVLAGFYQGTLDRTEESKTNAGNAAVDVFYTLKNGEKRHKILQRVADGHYLDRFYEQLMQAGVKKGSYLDELEEIEVAVEVSYNYNDFAQITVLPSKSVATKMSLLLEEDEEDDLLDEND